MIIYTDGACRGNGLVNSKGAYGFVVTDGEQVVHQSAVAVTGTTNNIMELGAVIAALKWVQENHPSQPVVIVSDSQYVVNGITTWLPGWKKKNWRTTAGPVKNQEFWVKLDNLDQEIKPQYLWVRGHDGNDFNELADKICNEAMDNLN